MLPLSEWPREQLIAHLVLHGWQPFRHAGDYNVAHADHKIYYVERGRKSLGVMQFSQRLGDYTEAVDRAERLSMRRESFPDDVIRMLVVALHEKGLL